MKRSFFYQYLLLHSITLSIAQSYYSINAPGIIKSNRKYTVAVALHEASGPCSIGISIEGPDFKESKNVTLKPYELKPLDFLPKKLRSGDYKLIAKGLSGLDLKVESKIFSVPNEGPNIYIQTDKAVYKPKDLVQFRVVILDEHTRPLNVEEVLHVDILDSEYNRVKQFMNVTLVKGVYTGKFQLAEYPVLGYWLIKVILGGSYNYSVEKGFAVRDYTLPKFSVFLKTSKDVVLEDGYIKAVLYGKYTFDKYVEGNATVDLWVPSNKTLYERKQINIENLGYVEFNIEKLKNETNLKGVTVIANITEKHTGRTETERQFIKLRNQRYQLNIPYDDIEFKNNVPFRIKVQVKHWTGAPVLDHLTPVTMEHGGDVYEEYLDETGSATFEFKHRAEANHKFQYKNSTQMLPNLYVSENQMQNNTEYYCRLRLLNKILKLGKPVLIEVNSTVHIPYLMYTLMGHASLTRSEYIKVPLNQKSYTIEITPSIEMIPRSFICVFYIHDGILRYEEMTLNFQKEFENQVSLRAPKHVRPGENVKITISGQPKSYVSIMAVDLGVYLLDKTYDLSRTDVLDDLLNEKTFSPILASVYPGIVSGIITLTNAQYAFAEFYSNKDSSSRSKSSQNPKKTIKFFDSDPVYDSEPAYLSHSLRFRQKFPETWIFDNYYINESTTELTIQIPDTVTTWRITAFTNNDITGFGIVNKPTDITTIQSLFISLNLPYSVKRGEIISIPVAIFNYLNQTVDVEVVLYNDDQEFYFMESKMQGDVEKSNGDQQQQTKHVKVPVNKAETVHYLIYPTRVGEVGLRITASSNLYSDGVVQKLQVEPEGILKQKNQAVYLSVPAGENISSAFTVDLPLDRVPESEYITFSVGGHYLVPTVENFHDLIQMPTGCGEQNMVNFAPSILILQYLKANGKLTKEKDLVLNLRSTIESGYQQQLSFRHYNGGYSIFGENTDDEPSTWLTAYVVRYFIKASKVISVEQRIIESDLEYLAEQQQSNGEFPYTGYLLNQNHMNAYGHTAFVLLTFLEDNNYAKKYKEVIQRGVEFLSTNVDNVNNIYALSVVATVLKRAKHNSANTVINQLKSYGREEKGLKWWSGNDVNPANDIEITAYTAMCLLETPGDHTSVLKWLIEQRNANGGFSSSHDTVVGMEALVKFSEKYQNPRNMNLEITYRAQDDKGEELKTGKLFVDSENLLVLQKEELPKSTRHVMFDMKGNGASLVQLTYQYNIADINEFRHFNITPKAILNNPDEVNLEVCFTYQPEQFEATNMVIMEVNLPSGFMSEEESRLPLKDNDLVQRIESKNADTSVVFYLHSLEGNINHCLNIPADKTNEILMPKPAAIVMYDYYNLTRSNTEFFSLK